MQEEMKLGLTNNHHIILLLKFWFKLKIDALYYYT